MDLDYKLNYKFQQKDIRDFIYPTNFHKDVNTTKMFVLDKTKFKIYDQGKIGSCVSNTIAGVINYYNDKINPSRLYIYFNGRVIINQNILDDTGFSVGGGCRSVHEYSVCNEQDWPYIDSAFSIMPSLNCYKTSYNFNNFIYYSIGQDLGLLKSCLMNGNPIIFGFMVYTSFMTLEVAKTGKIPMPSADDYIVITTDNDHKVLGGHSSIIIGFNDVEQVFICVNSWGEKWGDKGFFYMPYKYILDTSLSSDFTVINFTSPILQHTNIKMQFL